MDERMDESEIIDSYLMGQLDVASMADIERRLNADPSFAARVRLRKIVIASIHAAHEEELKAKLKQLDRAMDRTAQVKASYKIAASVALVLFSAMAVYLYFGSGNSKFKKYDLYEVGIPNTMGGANDLKFVTAMNYFKAAQYADALKSFAVVAQSDTVLYYAGVSAYRNGDAEKAIQYLKNIKQGSDYLTKANYRIGLAYWQQNRRDLAIQFLKRAAEDIASEYGKNANLILTKEF